LKKYLSLVLSVFVLTATVNTAQAFNKNHLTQLKKTYQCPKCDLRGANLSGANLTFANLQGSNLMAARPHQLRRANLSGATWIDGRKCKIGSIGKCVTKP